MLLGMGCLCGRDIPRNSPTRTGVLAILTGSALQIASYFINHRTTSGMTPAVQIKTVTYVKSRSDVTNLGFSTVLYQIVDSVQILVFPISGQ
jgi:hypothetical protein